MRFAPVFLTSLCMSTMSLALADQPVTADTPVASVKPVAVPADAAPAKGSDAPASPTAPTSTAPDPASKPQVSEAQIKEMRSAGYKMQKQKGQTMFCKSEVTLGSRFEHTTCGTYEDIKISTQNSQDFTNRMQQNTPLKTP
jgi:hypothetical protein